MKVKLINGEVKVYDSVTYGGPVRYRFHPNLKCKHCGKSLAVHNWSEDRDGLICANPGCLLWHSDQGSIPK